MKQEIYDKQGKPLGSLDKPEPIFQDGQWWEAGEYRIGKTGEYSLDISWIDYGGRNEVRLIEGNPVRANWIMHPIPTPTPDQLVKGKKLKGDRPTLCSKGDAVWIESGIWYIYHATDPLIGTYRWHLEPIPKAEPAPDGKGELLPCPFCGGKAKVYEGGFGERFVTCMNDNCGGRLGTGIWVRDEADAIKVWNTRHTPATPPVTDTRNTQVETATTAKIEPNRCLQYSNSYCKATGKICDRLYFLPCPKAETATTPPEVPDEKCHLTHCPFYNTTFDHNCDGELQGEPAIADCRRHRRVAPANPTIGDCLALEEAKRKAKAQATRVEPEERFTVGEIAKWHDYMEDNVDDDFIMLDIRTQLNDPQHGIKAVAGREG